MVEEVQDVVRKDKEELNPIRIVHLGVFVWMNNFKILDLGFTRKGEVKNGNVLSHMVKMLDHLFKARLQRIRRAVNALS
ncbi:unnamed protein product [Dovyalis caffra]|uniref:Uncharacterized protein n=1 Tax=Dovyalis caffra TaxID=77055 RepID=A0AAV1SMJ7_9ROSI|nr:unnamed protein product [Dovyalis caffra]